MPSSSVKALIKRFSNHLSKVCAVRSKRPAKNRRTQCSSTTYHKGHDSISANISMHPGSPAWDPSLGSSINIPSVTPSHGNSVARTISDVVQTVGPFTQGVASAIPIVGSPIQAAISGLLTILQVMDRRTQNRADLDRLTSRLQQLSLYLYNAPTPQDPVEQHRRKAIIGILEETSAQLTRLENCRLEYASVTQAIAGCSMEIDRYLENYLVFSSQMQNQHNIQKVLAILQKRQDSVGPTVTALGCVKLVDATGYEHPISVTFCTSFQQLNDMLQVLFKSESIQARTQRRYVEQGQYDLCIDDDKQVTRLTSHEWPRFEAGMTIVMRVILKQETQPDVEYQCHFCDAVNRTGAEHSLQAGCSINCRVCKRRFQISRGYSSKRETQSCVDHIPRTELEDLIRNFHVQQTRNNPNPNLHADGALALSSPRPALRKSVFSSLMLLTQR
ncbi:uncharacterized protein F5891DRAFT_1182502 [Suillus fuscotomentosus]|uniref:Ubiquitin-like domain-containing protein n=1 Tax=Suillus fuscotomentosus TaxID=1912939 RepID=A0AAD4HQE1_9AGAM|nr:uncharacterized protein F5891DRAFT_1182502 [Suillus fuscotomentosus]KAG1906255.1 hypothetical protein F5891DRAFT_1182502 [Suillus fuscotomentosus]